MLKEVSNGPSMGLLPNSSDVPSFSSTCLQGKHNSKRHLSLSDSGWSSKVYLQGVKTVDGGVLSSAGMAGISALGEDKYHFNSKCFQDFEYNLFNSATFYDGCLKSSFDDSTCATCKGILFGKLREAHMTIQDQAEKLAESKSELCLLRGQLESLSIEQEGLQREIDSLTVENKTFEVFKSESLKNREEFLMRVNDLDKALTVLSTTHNALQTKAKQKEALLYQTTNYVTALEHNNNKLQEDHKKIVEDHAFVNRQLFESLKATEDAKSKLDQLNTETVQLKMERNIASGKVIVLEDEVQQHKLNFSNLVREHEYLLKEKLEQGQRLQKEINERLCLKMVNDLLKEESAHVKEAFQKLEELTSALEQKSKDCSQDRQRLENPSDSTDEDKLKNWPSSIIESPQRSSVDCLKDEVRKIKETLVRLESEKTELVSQVSNLQNEQDMWLLHRSELEMTQAELLAENTQLRRELTTKLAAQVVEYTDEIKDKFEKEKEEAVSKTKESMKKSFDGVCLELKTVKSEFNEVWEMLERKRKEVEEHCHDLQQEQEESQKLSEELMRLRKDYADLAAKTSSRSQMICTLRDELMQKCQEIIELEATLSSTRKQKFSMPKATPLKGKTLVDDVNKSFEQSYESTEISQKEFKQLTAENAYLNQRVKELMVERDLALQDSQYLLNGMQQLREAFEEEMERQVEREKIDLKKEKQVLESQKDDRQLATADSKVEREISLLIEQNIALEVKSKHLEWERDELRDQVEELCRMRAVAAEEKAVQVDPPSSQRKPREKEEKKKPERKERETKTTLRKRSKSVGMMSPSSTFLEHDAR